MVKNISTRRAKY